MEEDVPAVGEVLQVQVDKDLYRPFMVLYADTATRVTGYIFFYPELDRHLQFLRDNIFDFIAGQGMAYMTLSKGSEIGQWRFKTHSNPSPVLPDTTYVPEQLDAAFSEHPATEEEPK